MIKKIIRNLSTLVQSQDGSFKRHNKQYEEAGKLEKDLKLSLQNISENVINGPEHGTLDLLLKHPSVNTVVDIGSGTGWVSSVLSKHASRIIAIEPSAAAIEIAETNFPKKDYPNIEWNLGLAENILPTIKLETPTLFVTGCVLSHLRDKETAEICNLVSKIAPQGSILSFVECWGDKEWHQLMWHVRTKDWWKKQLPGWELDFHGPEVPEKDTYKGKYNKGIWGVRTDNNA
jgi:trans-aconitate methyltransferase